MELITPTPPLPPEPRCPYCNDVIKVGLKMLSFSGNPAAMFFCAHCYRVLSISALPVVEQARVKPAVFDPTKTIFKPH